MPSSGIIDLAIGLTFVFGATAALISILVELIARLIGLRGAYLLVGLRELLDGGQATTNLATAEFDYLNMQNLMLGAPQQSAEFMPPSSVTGALLGGPILGNQGVAGQLATRKLTLGPTTGTGRLPKMTSAPESASLWSQRRSLPSYISARSFAEAVIDLLMPHPQGQTTMDAIEENIQKLPPGMPFRQSLQALVKNADNDVSRFRTSVGQWYDDHMDRVSGWYKRHTAKITLAAGAILVVLLNLNVVNIGRTVYTENAVSAAVSTVAAKATTCSGQRQQDCLANLEGQLSAAAAAGLPVGWGTVRDCTEPGARCNWLDQRGIFSRHGNSGWQLVLVFIGFLIMIISIVPGAQFWFGLLSKLGSLRASGPKPPKASS